MATASSTLQDMAPDIDLLSIPSDSELESRSIPSLVQLCQKVAALHVERLDSIEGIRIDLVKPLLERCSADTLLRLEQASPDLEDFTDDIWRSLCFRTYALAAQSLCMKRDPDSWRKAFFDIREQEAKRFADLGQRLRSQREEAEQKKKEGQVKFTDRLQPPRRRGWIPAPPKTLFQKTRSDAAKMQKGIYGAQRTPVIPPAKVSRILPSSFSAKIFPPAPVRALPTTPVTAGTRVTVTAVNVRRNPTPALKPSPKPAAAIFTPHHSVVTHSTPSPDAKRQRTSLDSGPLAAGNVTSQERAVPLKPPLQKKDPKASLFIPKHRLVSQLPTAPGVRSR